jgi:aurora kinase
VAIKAYKKAALGPLNCTQVLREVEIHIGLNHPGIIQMYAAFEDPEFLYIVLELAEGGDLYRRVKTGPCHGRLPERETSKFILGPFLSALRYLHLQAIIHRDIKPENICLNAQNEVKIIDFGLAINASKERPVTRLGTLEYMVSCPLGPLSPILTLTLSPLPQAPEVLLCPQKDHPGDNKECDELTYTSAIDIWAVGVLAYELMTGKAPFERQDGTSMEQNETCIQILEKDPVFPTHLSTLAISFIRLCMTKNPMLRPSVDELLCHPFLEPYQATLRPATFTIAHLAAARSASFSNRPRVDRVFSTPSIEACPPLNLAALMAVSGSAASSPRPASFVSPPPSQYKTFTSMSYDFLSHVHNGCDELNDGRG